jgi:hypothetical protein
MLQAAKKASSGASTAGAPEMVVVALPLEVVVPVVEPPLVVPLETVVVAEPAMPVMLEEAVKAFVKAV